MPNFWTGLGRMMSGKPIYDPNDPDIQQHKPYEDNPIDQQVQDPAAQVPVGRPANGIIKGNESTYPKLEIRRVDNHYNGDNVEIYFRIYNPTNMQLWIERVQLCGSDHRIRDDLRPHQEQQYSVYNGKCMKSDHEREVKIKFRTMEGDYFQIEFEIRYRYLRERGIYEVDECHQHHAVRDIYEGGF